MSLIPFFLDQERPRRMFDQHFGLGIRPEDFLSVASPVMSPDYYRPWRHLAAAIRDVGSTIKNEADKFQINLDVQHFSPEEIAVKTANGCVVVEGKHEEKPDEHGHISRHFVRRYALPEGCNIDTVESKLSSDGVLIVTAPKQRLQAAKDERAVPITHTGPVKKQIESGETEKKE